MQFTEERADKSPQNRKNIFHTTRTRYNGEPILLRLKHAFKVQQIPTPDFDAEFFLAKPPTVIMAATGPEIGASVRLPEATVREFQDILEGKKECTAEILYRHGYKGENRQHESAAAVLDKLGYTSDMLMRAADAITRHREKTISQKEPPSLKARVEYLIGHGL